MIRFCEGERVLVNGRLCIIKRVPSFDVLEVQDVETGVWNTVVRSDVHPPLAANEKVKHPVIGGKLTSEQERIRDLRYETIKPALNRICSKEVMDACCAKAVEVGLLKKGDPSTIRDWIDKLRVTGNNNINVLAPPIHPTGGRGGHRLTAEVDSLLEAILDGSFLTSQKKLPTEVYWDVRRAFKKENRRRENEGQPLLTTPCKKTVLSRIKAIDPRVAEEARYGKKSAKERFGIMKGHLSCGRWPFDLGQLDHKKLRPVVIDDVTGEALGNPYLTVIIDTNSTVPPGFVLSLKTPSAENIGLCLAMSMVQKEFWLKEWGMDQEDFPVFGKWGTVQVDNELKNEAGAIIEGCRKRDIELEFRPLRNPQAGGYIESFFRTLDLELRNIPGFLSKNRKDNENYNANKEATFTFKRLYHAIAIVIIKIYCLRKHSRLQNSPLNTYKQNLISSGIGIPEMLIGDEIRNLILDFMPFKERTIQEYGIEIFNMYYRSELLEEYIKVGKKVK